MTGERRPMFAAILFTASVAGGIAACMTRSILLLLLILLLEAAFIMSVPACRGYEMVWGFILFCGTMIPAHLFWFFPAIISAGEPGAFEIATIIVIFYGLFSVELLLLVFILHRAAEFRRKRNARE